MYNTLGTMSKAILGLHQYLLSRLAKVHLSTIVIHFPNDVRVIKVYKQLAPLSCQVITLTSFGPTIKTIPQIK